MTGPHKVLFIPSWYPSLAHPTAGVFIREQARALSATTDIAVLHVDSGGPGRDTEIVDEDGVLVARAAVQGGGPKVLLLDYRRAGLVAFERVREAWGTPDVVHVQALWPAALIAREIKRRYGIPYVVTEHSEEYLAESKRRLVKVPGVVPLLLRPLARAASRTIAVSAHLRDRLVELGLARTPVVVPNIIPVSEPVPLPTAAPFQIVHVSVMGPAKNLPMLLEAVHLLRQRRTDFRLRLIGDGECRPELERLTAALGIEDFVSFEGRHSSEDVRTIIGESVCTVVSSTHETFSVVAAESLMCGRPVLSTRCGGPEEFITSDVGRLIENGDTAAMVEGLDWMLDHFAEFDRQSLHAYAKGRFSPEVVAAQIVDVYREVLRD